jgi:hypothetical protein
MTEKKKAVASMQTRTAKNDITELRAYSNTRVVSSGKKQTKRQLVMLAYHEAVQSLTPGANFSALKGNLMFALNAKWSMANKIEFFQRFAADARKIGAR